MNRTLRTLPVGVLLVVLTACTPGAPTGATLPPLTTTAVTTGSTAPSAGAAGSTTDPTTEALTSESESSVVAETPVDVTVPPEASALPLPTAQVDIPADNPQEEADRAAIEAVWRQVWDLVRDGYSMTPAVVNSTADALLLDPIKTQIVNGSIAGKENGRVTYGKVTLAPYWYESIDGKNVAQLGDCIDFSAFGLTDVQSGEVLTTGQSNSNTVGTFVKSSDGRWLLTQVTTLEETPCSVD